MTVDGRVKVRCLDFQDDQKDDVQVKFGRSVAIINSVVFITSVLAGGLFGYHVAGQFDEERLQDWYEAWQEKEKEKKAARKTARDFRRSAARMENRDGESDATELVVHGPPRLASAI